jgi:hypothetical protein
VPWARSVGWRSWGSWAATGAGKGAWPACPHLPESWGVGVPMFPHLAGRRFESKSCLEPSQVGIPALGSLQLVRGKTLPQMAFGQA